jgi:hypothetical protein
VGKARFAVLAVVDDVDAEIGLLADHLDHGAADPAREIIRVVGITPIFRMQRCQQLAWPWEAAAVSGQDSGCASFHGAYPWGLDVAQ